MFVLLGLWWKPLLLQKGCPPSVPSLCGSLLVVMQLIWGSSRLIPALCIPSTNGEHSEEPWFAGVQLAWLCIGGVEMRSVQNSEMGHYYWRHCPKIIHFINSSISSISMRPYKKKSCVSFSPNTPCKALPRCGRLGAVLLLGPQVAAGAGAGAWL